MKQYDYSKLKGRIRESFPNQSEFAKQLELSEASLSYKLNNKKAFSQNQIQKAIEILNLTAQETKEYFFTLKVDKKSTRISNTVQI